MVVNTTKSRGLLPTLNRGVAVALAALLLAPVVALTGTSQANAQANVAFTAIQFGDTWSYLDDGTDQGTAWQAPAFDDSGWASGASELGYGDGGEATVISFGPDSTDKYRTTYFRREFTVPSGVQSAEVRVVRDDGVAIHINGVEVGVDNLPATYDYLTKATTALGSSTEADPVTFTLDPAVLVTGTNTIAVEVHQANSASSDVSFNLELTGVGDGIADNQSPSIPTNLTAPNSTSSSIELTWSASSDNVAVQSYDLYRDGVLVGSVAHPSTTFIDNGLQSDTSYSYQVLAVDTAGNESALSGAITASTTVSSTVGIPAVADSTWQTNGVVRVVLPVGDTIYIGGEFTNMNDGNGTSVQRNNLAAIDRLTGLPTAFDPNMNGKVFALTTSMDASTLYVGGSFTRASGQNRKRIAAFDTANGALSSFRPPFPNDSVRGLGTDGTRLFVGGLFDKVGPDARLRLAAYDIATETLDPTWTPSADGGVKSLIVDPDKVWVAGNFTDINNLYAKGLGAVALTDGALLPTDHPGIPILDIATLGNQIFAAGAGPGGTAAAYNRTTGAFQWSKHADGNVQGVAALGDFVYFGGHYEDIDGNAVGRLTRHDLLTGELDVTWLPDVNGSRSVNDVAAAGFSVHIGGDFTFVSGDRHVGYAMFSDRPSSETPAELVSLTMLDVDQNGLVDTVEALFDKTLQACAAPCTDGWTLTGVPSGGTLSTVSTNGSVATLQLAEGNGGVDTAVGNFEIGLSSPSDVRDVNGLEPFFAGTRPVDAAMPVADKMWKSNAGTGGLAESGDSITITWSERIDPTSLPATTDVVISDLGNGGNDQLTIPGLLDGAMDLGSGDYLVCAGGPCVGTHQATFAGSAITRKSGGTFTTVTLSSCSGDCSELSSGPRTTVTYVAPSSIADVDGNGAVGSFQKTFKLF